MTRNIFMLADRLKKTPEEIRTGFTYEDYVLFLAHIRLLDEEQGR